MARIPLVGPAYDALGLNTREANAERGWGLKTLIDAINIMFAELYGAGTTAFATTDDAVTVDRALGLKAYTVETAPEVGAAGTMIFVTDGDGGSPCLAISDGTDWKAVALGSAIAAE